MMSYIEKVLDFVLKCIMPLPYCEVDGHKFWRKKSYESWLELKELNRMRNEGNLHHINYRNGYQHAAEAIQAELMKHLDMHNGKIYKVIYKHFEPCNGSYDAMYLCNKKLDILSRDAEYIVEDW